MGLCAQVLVNKVLCEETFTISKMHTDIPIGAIFVPPGSTITGQTYANILECEPIVNYEENCISVILLLMVQEELTLITPTGATFPLEFAFRMKTTLPFSHCFFSELGLIDLELNDELECRTKIISGSNQISLHPSILPKAFDASFDQNLELKINIKLLQESQLRLTLCPPTPIPIKVL